MPYFPEEVVEHTFSYIISHRDRNAVSMVCKAWYRIERLSRRSVFIGNCYSVKPERVMDRFPYVKSLVLKGKPHFADLNLIPKGWGGFAKPWIEAAVQKWPGMEEIRLKRMVVRDKDLELLARSFSNFKALVLDRCEGFSYSGLAAIAVHCRFLKKLDLQETVVIEHGPQWLNFFPDSSTSLVSLNFACLKGAVSPITLERLVARSPNLKSLRLNRAVSAEMLVKILARAPQLTDLGLSSVIFDTPLEAYHRVSSAVDKCKSLRSLSGFWNAPPRCLEAFYPVCGKLTALNLSYARAIQGATLIKIIHQCHKLRRLWVVDRIGDEGLEAVATTCKHLQELSVFPSKITRWGPASVTEEGLISVSSGCRKLNSLLYYCRRMTNLALITVAKNCPNFIRFRLCILTPGNPDPLTNQPLDEGFGAIVQSCKNLKRLSLSGLLTDQVFIYIGMYAEKLEMLSVALAGQSDKGMAYVLNGCRNLKKLEIRDSPFGDSAILENVNKFANMRFLWMSSCDLTLRGCKTLATKMPMLNVEVMSVRDDDGDDKIDEDNKDLRRVETLYVYRTTAGPREDVPNFVQTL